MKVYAMFCGEYSDRRLVGVYTSLAAAEAHYKKLYLKYAKEGELSGYGSAEFGELCASNGGGQIEVVDLDGESLDFWKQRITHNVGIDPS